MFFTIDTSGSMTDICQDDKRKIEHIYHTLENMLKIFHENRDCNISIHIQSFDTSVKTIISDVSNIHDANVEELVQLIKQRVRPYGLTNVQLALEKANEEIYNYYIANPEHEIVHIFLTDGEITSGLSEYTRLQKLVPKNCVNIFIGYGLDHDSELLSQLSIEKSNEYRFIDALEKAGLVYGEVIHGILYKAIEDVTLLASGAELYDYQKNSWTTDLSIGNLLSEQTKTFHVRTKNVDGCYVSINGKTIVKTRQFQKINIYEKQMDVGLLHCLSNLNDLGVYLFRQRTLELLYKSRQLSELHKRTFAYNPTRELNDFVDLEESFELFQQQQQELKECLKEFHKSMLNYMKDKNLENNPMMKMLCDDVYISYKTTGTPLGSMYTRARQSSNGRQQTYMCSATHTQDLYNDVPKTSRTPHRALRLQRQRTPPPTIELSRNTTQVPRFENRAQIVRPEQIDNDDIETYAPTLEFLSPFSSDGVITLMREVSGNHSIGHTLADDTDGTV